MLAADGRRVTAAELDQALDQLARRALVTFTVDGQTVIMHRLVAWVIRDELARRERLTAGCRSAASMLEARLETVAGSPDRQAVRDFPEQVAAVAANAGGADRELTMVLLRLRLLALHHLMKLDDAMPQVIAVGAPLLADLERTLGPGHPETRGARNTLAAAYTAADQPAGAIPLLEQILAGRERLLGLEHPDTLRTRNDLAAAYRAAGRPADALPQVRQVLAARERMLGMDDLSTLAARNNLASSYRSAGRPAEAIGLFEENLAACERVLGAGHPRTAATRRHLDLARQEAVQEAAGAGLADQVGGDLQDDGP